MHSIQFCFAQHGISRRFEAEGVDLGPARVNRRSDFLPLSRR
jgi:hypothetical protein